MNLSAAVVTRRSSSEKKMIDVATRVQDEMAIFEEEGFLQARAEMMKSFMKSGETQKSLETI